MNRYLNTNQDGKKRQGMEQEPATVEVFIGKCRKFMWKWGWNMLKLQTSFKDLWVQAFSLSIKRVYLNCFGLKHSNSLLTASLQPHICSFSFFHNCFGWSSQLTSLPAESYFCPVFPFHRKKNVQILKWSSPVQPPEPIFSPRERCSAQGSFSAVFIFLFSIFWGEPNLGDSMHSLGKHEVSRTCKNQ